MLGIKFIMGSIVQFMVA